MRFHFVLVCAASALAAWPPVSLWLLLRARASQRKHQNAAQAVQAQLSVELFRISRRDPLTGLPTRRAFLDMMAACLTRDEALALVLIDIDEFASINSNFGETVADELLVALAGRLRQLGGACGRLGRLDGDSFALLLDHAEPQDDITGAVEGIRQVLSEPYSAAGQLLDLTFSVGVARAPAHGNTAEALLRAAAIPLAQAKGRGGGRWLSCGPELARTLHDRALVHGQLRRAIASGQIVPWYQPIVRLPTGEVASLEVLARWLHPEFGVLLPEQFIPLAEEMGLSGHVSMALLRQVAVDSQEWPETCRIAINVSGGQTRELIGFFNAQPGDWQRRMDLSRLNVEITEAALMRDRAMARELIDTLHEHGARAGLDNFGSGVSNFSFLRDMPFDSIKIDKTFIATMLDDPRAEACVLSMLWLGHGLGVEVVADGVEAEAVAQRLAELGCSLAQGFFYARPGPAAEMSQLIQTRMDLDGKGATACMRTQMTPPVLADQ